MRHVERIRREGIGCGAQIALALSIAALVLSAVAIVLAPTGHRHPRAPHLAPARPAPPGTAYGASVNLLFDGGRVHLGAVAAQLSALHATGASFARSDALWEATEPRPPAGGRRRFDWLFDDVVAASLARAHLRWLAIIDYSAPWAQSVSGVDHSPPRVDADYAAYAQAFAARYGTGGSFWRHHPSLPDEPVTTIEVWNEPDNPEFWSPRPDPAAYARLYVRTREAVDAVDPSARVIVGGLTAPTRFLPALVRAMPSLVGHVDGVAIHPYGRPAVVLARVTAARATLRTLGMGSVPLYVTEFGWTTSPPGAADYAPAARRPRYVRTTLSELRDSGCGIAAASLYTWASSQRDPGDAANWYGISPTGAAGDSTGTDDAAVAAFRAGIRGTGPAHPSPARPRPARARQCRQSVASGPLARQPSRRSAARR